MASLRLLVLAAALFAGTCVVYGRHTRGIGKDDVITNTPWLAQIGTPSGYICTGNVMDSTHILTAAHCFNPEMVADPSKAGVKVRVGSTDLNFGGEVRDVVKIDMHPKASYDKHENEMYDLAVMTLAKPIQFGANVKPIEFATEQVEAPLIVYGGGWGVTNEKKQFKPVLQTFSLEMWTTGACDGILSMRSVLKTAALMCFSPKTGVACGGDSGSGAWTTKNGKPQLIGVLHGGNGCSMESINNVYVNVLSDVHRPFLSKFFDMSRVPVTARPSEDINDMLRDVANIPGALPQYLLDAIKDRGLMRK